MAFFKYVWIWMAVVWLLTVFLREYVYSEEIVCGRRKIRVRVGFAVITWLPFIIGAATRKATYADTGMYLKEFHKMPSSIGAIPGYLMNVPKDQGFYALSALIKAVFGENTIIYLGIIALIQGLILAMVFRKYSSDFLLSTFLFLATTDYISWMHNGIRQFMAVTIIFAGTALFVKRRFVPAILLILLASTMHQSALLMLPVLFIVQGRAWNLRTVLLLAAALLAIAYVGRFTDLLDGMLSNTQYSSVVSDWKEWEDDGTSPIRVFIYSIPTILSLVGLRYIREADDPFVNVCVNMSIISTGLYLISMVTSGIFIGRLPIYCSLWGMGCLLPWEIRHMFTPRSALALKLMAILGFLGFYYYQMHIGWGLI
ncbi:MAG: EpsG family protein [Eubacterium sp.]|nr:EpsG family protein [Eubacterium sp.]